MRSITARLFGGAIMVLLSLSASVHLSQVRTKEPDKGADAENNRKTIVKILKSKEIWDKGFPSALARVNVWSEAKIWPDVKKTIYATYPKEKSAVAANQKWIMVYPKKIVGIQRFSTQTLAENARVLLEKELGKERLRLTPDFSAFGELEIGKPDVKIAVITNFADDDSNRIAWEFEASPLLRRYVSMATVYKEFGKPVQVSSVVLRSPDSDRRPMILTMHAYAGGAIWFAQSDWSPKPSSVDRVFLDVDAISQVLFEGYKEK